MSLNKISARRRYASEQPGEARLLASRKVPKEVSLRGRYGLNAVNYGVLASGNRSTIHSAF